MNYDEQIQALLDQNEASKMLAKVGLKTQSQSTNRDFQLLVAEYSTKAPDSDELCRLLRITRDSSEVFLVEDALMEKGDLTLAQSIVEKAPPSSVPKIMDNLVDLAVTVVAPQNQTLIDFIKSKRKEMTPRALMQFDMLQATKPTHDPPPVNLVNLMANKVICDPADCVIFELCQFIRAEAAHLLQLRRDSEMAEKEESKKLTEKTVSLKNATMKLQQHNQSQENLDKFLQRLEGAAVQFVHNGKTRLLLEVMGAYKPDVFPSSSDCNKLTMEGMQSSLNEQITEQSTIARLSIVVNKLIQKQLDSGDINLQLLRAALSSKTDVGAAKLLDDAIMRAKSQQLRLKILEFAVEYFPKKNRRHHDYLNKKSTLKWEMDLERHGVKTRLDGSGKVEAVCYNLLNSSSVKLGFVKEFCNEMNVPISKFFFGFLKYHLLGEPTADFLSKENGALVSAHSRPTFAGSVQSLVTAAAWSQTNKRLAEIIEMFIEQDNVTGVLEILADALDLVDKTDYTRIRFILDQINDIADKTQSMTVSVDHSKLRRLLDVFNSYKRVRQDGTEVRIPFLVGDREELQKKVEEELKPSNYFDLLPIATSELVCMQRIQLTLKVVGKCDHLTLDKAQLDHYVDILKVSSKGEEREMDIKMATRCYKFIMERIESPIVRLQWIAAARRELEPLLPVCSQDRQNEIKVLLALDKILKIEKNLELYGLYSSSVRDFTRIWITQNNVDITKPMILQLFELLYHEFFVAPYDKKLTKALEDTCQIAEQKLRKVQAELLYRFITSIPAQINAAKTIIEVANPSESAEVLFHVINDSEDDETKAAVFSMILQFFDEQEIMEASRDIAGSAIKTEMIQDLVFMHSLFAECNKVGIRMNKKTFQTLQKSPAKTIKSMLEGMTDTQEGLLIIIDLCIRFEVKEENIWLVLFETISEPSVLVDRLIVLNSSEWFSQIHVKSKQLFNNYHMAWNKGLANLYDTEPDRAILAFWQFQRPIRLDIPRLFSLALAMRSPVHCLQIAARAKLAYKRRMVDQVIEECGGTRSLLELIRSKPFLGSHDALSYVLWSLKPSDFSKMDKPLLRWTRDKMVEYGHLSVFIEYLIQTRQNQDLLSFILEFAKTDKKFGVHLASIRSMDEMAKLESVKNYFNQQSSIPGYFSITA